MTTQLMVSVIDIAAPKDYQTVAYSRQIAELLRIALGRKHQPVDDVALRELMHRDERREPLVEMTQGSLYPILTTEGARVVGELIAVFEEQT